MPVLPRRIWLIALGAPVVAIVLSLLLAGLVPSSLTSAFAAILSEIATLTLALALLTGVLLWSNWQVLHATYNMAAATQDEADATRDQADARPAGDRVRTEFAITLLGSDLHRQPASTLANQRPVRFFRTPERRGQKCRKTIGTANRNECLSIATG